MSAQMRGGKKDASVASEDTGLDCVSSKEQSNCSDPPPKLDVSVSKSCLEESLLSVDVSAIGEEYDCKATRGGDGGAFEVPSHARAFLCGLSRGEGCTPATIEIALKTQVLSGSAIVNLDIAAMERAIFESKFSGWRWWIEVRPSEGREKWGELALYLTQKQEDAGTVAISAPDPDQPRCEVHNEKIHTMLGKQREATKVTTSGIHPSFLLPIDPRAVALFRIGLALCALNEWFVAFSSREAFLYDDGMLPRKAWIDSTPHDMYSQNSINMWMATGSAEGVLTLLVFQLLLTLSLLVGYCSRLSSLVLFVFMNSWNLRLDTKQGGGIEVLSVFLLWGALLPLGGSFALDAIRNGGLGSGKQHGSTDLTPEIEYLPRYSMYLRAVERFNALVALSCNQFISIAIPLHLAIMYWACGVVKETEPWNSGHAVLMTAYSGMSCNQPWARMLSKVPTLCRLLTHATYYLETYGGFTLLIPSETVRLVSLMVLLPFHLGMHLVLDIGMFQPTMGSALLLLTPTRGCDALERAVSDCTWAARQKGSALCLILKVQGAVLIQTGQRSAKAMIGCLGGLFLMTMAIVMITTISNDLCMHVTYKTGGQHNCWLGLGRDYPLHFKRWLILLGYPQYHAPFQNIDTHECYHHLVGIVEEHDQGCNDRNGNTKTCSVREKAVALFTDRTTSQLNFDHHFAWKPDEPPHSNVRWMKFFRNPRTLKRGGHVLLADHVCRKWNRRPGYPKLRSVANVRVWKHMVPLDNGSLDFSSTKYTITYHFRCSDRGQEGHASNSTLIANKMKEAYSVDRMEISLMNNVNHPLQVYWLNPKTGAEVFKGYVAGRNQWYQAVKIGDTFKFYWHVWSTPEGGREKEELLAQVMKVGQTEGSITVESKPDWELTVENKAPYPLHIYWLQEDTGREFPKGRILQNSTWSHQAKLGHMFHLYWEVPNAPKILAQETKVGAENKPIVIGEPKKILIRNAARYPLILYWLHPGTGVEMAKERVEKHSAMDQSTKVGHFFRLYWDIPDGVRASYAEERLLAREFAVSAIADEILVEDRSEWV